MAMHKLSLALYQTLVLAWRHYVVWSRKIWMFLCLYVLGPIVLLYGLGVAFGLQDKLSFVVPGMMINSAVMAAFIGCSYGAMERFYGQRYEGWLSATLRPWQLIAAEAIFQAAKGAISVSCIWVAGVLLGAPLQMGAWLFSLPVSMLVGATAAMLGYCLVAVARTYDDITLSEPVTTAAFVFSGVFVTVSAFPAPLQWFAYMLPVYHGIELIRPFFTGDALSFGAAFGHLAVLLLMLGGASLLATKLFTKRLMS
jgi:lipooligosaccharide transport system permease protein